MLDQPCIAIFEDNDDNYRKLSDALSKEIKGEFKFSRYMGDKDPPPDWRDAERWIRDYLLTPTPAILTVIDWDLSGFRHSAQQQFIRGIAEDLSIPTILYQSINPADQSLERLKRWQERRIAVESTVDKITLAHICADVARGVEQIRQKVAKLGKTPRLLETLKQLLQPPNSSPLHLEQFAVGNQELLRVVGRDFGEEQKRFVATWIGYLIYNRILQFPGPILKEVAAAAYLCIAIEEMRKEDVRQLLETAQYKGPFWETQTGWWRAELDGMIAAGMEDTDTNVPTGRVIIERKLGRLLAPARCHEGELLDESAYLCILTQDIVCDRHSDAPDSWIPQGADRCRIHREELELLQGWLGI